MYLVLVVGLLFLNNWLYHHFTFLIHCHLHKPKFHPWTPPHVEPLNSYFQNNSSESWCD
jgi:hypothetical protein